MTYELDFPTVADVEPFPQRKRQPSKRGEKHPERGRKEEGWKYSLVVGCLPSMHEDLGSNSSIHQKEG